ncbi:NleE/OspZ family T3SS effector cysteine methyltransferase [Salmonella enterica]|nr:NleE/OspZ family T3SS effector cysteine methyltransferase [Salmonella enterica]EFW6054608.1 NleE/OspZ family T3SS effector cysteine methyltransferase [Salmonella enterica]EGL7020348.1 NleE/OspZ family T3SS effector cysteine methyltransferase [Salmonella enterica]EHD9908928.1 NleE/OspZ family T3SS effector cysteine methyltransferase [Salmonella enterica]EIO3761622.1 NleE/OspZ family T3SS effector cysteine methyltransferase [Salmonella enterica]
MKIPSINNQNISFPDRINAIDIIVKTYPDVTPYFFMEKPNIYDQKYISGITREQSVFKVNGYINKKAELTHYMQRMYSGSHINFKTISRDEANTPEGSWLTVITGKRPMGQFSVDSLYSPVLHSLLELPNIGCKIFPKEDNSFLYIIVVYRKDCAQGEQYADRFIELYNKKRELMCDMSDESNELKTIKSELVVAREMGTILSYLPEEIDNYISKMNLLFLKKTN